MTASSPEASKIDFARKHFRFGWWSLLVFLSFGLGLETLHGWKVGWYVDADNETRRLMWTLAHAHGTLIALVHIAFATSTKHFSHWQSRSRAVASLCLVAAGILLPLGFALGGLFIYDGDPGLGILLVPIGAVLLFVAVLLTARGAGSAPPSPD